MKTAFNGLKLAGLVLLAIPLVILAFFIDPWVDLINYKEDTDDDS